MISHLERREREGGGRDRGEREGLMVGGRKFQKASAEGTKEDCMAVLQKMGGIEMFDGW